MLSMFDISVVLICVNKVRAGNSGHPKTPDTRYISAMEVFWLENFGAETFTLFAISIPKMS